MSKQPAIRIGDDAVKAKTGRDWQEWTSLLDQEDGRKLSHKELVGLVKRKYNVGPWWGQMVVVGYEQATGKRELHEKLGGYEISVSKTVNIPIGMAFLLFEDPKMRRRWIKESAYEVRKSTPNKSLRATWIDGETVIVVDFYAKSSNKTQVVVQHQKLQTQKDAQTQKDYWSKQLEKLKETVA